MDDSIKVQYTAFEGPRRIAAGDLAEVARTVKQQFKDEPVAGVLIFEDGSSHLLEVDFRGTVDDVLARIAPAAGKLEAPAAQPEPESGAPRGPGRPKLGVVAREITLLPRHWDWLNSQPGGASVVLRKLVEQARRGSIGRDRIRLAQEASYRFMSAAISGGANFEEVARALFAGNRERFNALVEPWPADLRDYLKQLADAAFDDVPEPDGT